MKQSTPNSGISKLINYFNAKVLPEAQKVETTRQILLNIACVVGGIPGAIIIFIVLIMLSRGLTIDVLLTTLLFGVAFFLCFAYTPFHMIRTYYGLDAKKKILPRLLGFWGNYQFIPQREPLLVYIYNCLKNQVSISQAIKDYLSYVYPDNFDFKALNILVDYQSLEIDDCIHGKYKDINMEVCELRALRISKESNGSTTKSVTFQGVALAADITKPFKGMTAISSDAHVLARLNNPRIALGINNLDDVKRLAKEITNVAKYIQDNKEELLKKSESPLADMAQKKAYRIHLEDPDFEAKFKTFSHDQIESRYLLTTAFMERFLKMAKKYNYKVKAIFAKQRLYIMIETGSKNWFEVPFTKSTADVNNYKTLLADFSGLLAILDTLKLEQKIGM